MTEPSYLRHLAIFKVRDAKVNEYREGVQKRAKAELLNLVNQPYLEEGTLDRCEGQDFFKSMWWTACREAVLHRDNYHCTMCGSMSKKLEVHHIIPRHCGGPDNPLNLRTLCVECHKEVHRRMNE